MKAILVTVVILLCYSNSFSQKNHLTIQDGDDVVKSFSDSIKFLYSQFVSGYVYFENGTMSRALLNYNLLVEEMQFIKGNDTLAIANESTIKLITVYKDSF